MDNLAKQFTKNVKAFFPIVGKAEKEYLKKLELNLEDYCEEKQVSSLEELYKDFGTPSDVVHSYYSSVNIDYILKRLRLTKIIKTCLVTLIIAILVTVSAYCLQLYSGYQVFKQQQIFFEETIIE